MLNGITLNGMLRFGIVKQVIRGTIAIASAQNASATIAAVVPENSIIHHLGATSNNGDTDPAKCFFVRLSLASATSVRADLGAAGSGTTTVSFEVIEFYPGVVRVQRGTLSGGTTTTTATINAVVTGKTFISSLGFSFDSSGLPWGSYSPYHLNSRLELTNSTTLTQTLDTSHGGFAITTSYEVIELLMQGLQD